jgi:hypothetical protein
MNGVVSYSAHPKEVYDYFAADAGWFSVNVAMYLMYSTSKS